MASRFVEDGLDLGGYFTNDREPSGRGDGSSALHRGQGIPGPAQGVMWPALIGMLLADLSIEGIHSVRFLQHFARSGSSRVC